MAAKKITKLKTGVTPGNRQYTSKVMPSGERKTVVYHPNEGAVIKSSHRYGSSKREMNTPAGGGKLSTAGGGSIAKGPTKPAPKVDLPGGSKSTKKKGYPRGPLSADKVRK